MFHIYSYFLTLYIFIYPSFRSNGNPNVRWLYSCVNNKCERTKYIYGLPNQYSLSTCNMLCGKPQLWPFPTKRINYGRKPVSFFKERLYIHPLPTNSSVAIMLKKAYEIFYENVARKVRSENQYRLNNSDVSSVVISTFVHSTVLTLSIETEESYQLEVSHADGAVEVNIRAETFFGVRHALETLSQLIWWDEFDNGGTLKILTDVLIEDAPKFSYRGVMIDTARNFFPLEELKNVVIGMAACKLNVLHLHLTDSTSFPIILPRAPKFAEYGSYGPSMVYTADDIEELKTYAIVRGVRLVLEIDAPSHVNSGWEWGPDNGIGDLVICKENIFKGQLNPDNPRALDALEKIYNDLLDLSGQDDIFHIGGDEVDLHCWSHTNSRSNYTDMTHFWADYVNRMLNRLKIANSGTLPKHVVMWSSPLTASTFLKEIQNLSNIAIQFWLGDPTMFLSNGIKVIYSTVGHWYLDCGFGRWKPDMQHGVCDPYTPWQTFYEYRPWITYSHQELTLGGEVCLWSEQVEIDSLETRLWPRAAAFAERIWTDPTENNDYDIYTRLVSQRERLMERGLKAAAMWPRWCSLNPGKC